MNRGGMVMDESERMTADENSNLSIIARQFGMGWPYRVRT